MQLPLRHFKITILLTGSLLLFACNKSQVEPNAKTKATTTHEKSGNKLKDAPDFTLTRMNGQTFTLSEHFGKIIVLNIWATWCRPCREEIPDFIELQNEMKDDVLFLGVSIDREGWKKVRPFAHDLGINYPVMVDDGSVNAKYGPFRVVPTTFLINKQGKVAYVAPGMVTKDMLKPVLDKLAKR